MEIRRFEQRCFDQRYNERVRKLADRFHEGIIASPLTARIDDSLRVVLSSRLVSTEVASIGVVAQALVDCVSTSWCYAVAADDESSRVRATTMKTERRPETVWPRIFLVTNRDIHSLYMFLDIFSSPFSLYALFCPHFSISFDTWRARSENTIYLNC